MAIGEGIGRSGDPGAKCWIGVGMLEGLRCVETIFMLFISTSPTPMAEDTGLCFQSGCFPDGI